MKYFIAVMIFFLAELYFVYQEEKQDPVSHKRGCTVEIIGAVAALLVLILAK